MIGRLRSGWEAVRRGGLRGPVAQLAGGTGLAQLVSLLALPVLARLYSPADFDLLAVFMAVLTLLSIVACLRLELAIPLPEREEDAASLLVGAMLANAAMTALLAAVVAGWGDELARWWRQPELAGFLWMLPLGVGLTGALSALQYWSTRQRRFAAFARTRVTQALAGNGLQIGLGLTGVGPVGLLLGQLARAGTGGLRLLVAMRVQDGDVFGRVNAASVRRQCLHYSRLPRFSTFEALASVGAVQLPVLLIAALSAGPEAGFLAMAMRVMAAPQMLLGSAVGQVYLSRAAGEQRAGTLGGFTTETVSSLMKTSMGPLVFAALVLPVALPGLFGDAWTRTGALAAWMVPWVALELLATPIAMVMHVRGRQVQMLMLTVGGLALRLGGVAVAARLWPAAQAEVFMATGAVQHLVQGLVFLRVAGADFAALGRTARAQLGPVLLWLLAAVVLRVLGEKGWG